MKNVGARDRDVRMAIGLIAGFLGVFVLVGWIQIPFVLLSVIMIYTSIKGTCPIYSMADINTNKPRTTPDQRA